MLVSCHGGAASNDDVAELIARMRAERETAKRKRTGMHSIGGWHTRSLYLGRGWLGEPFARRLERAGWGAVFGACWGNILPPGAEYGAHSHGKTRLVAVWCLADGDGGLHIEPDIVVPDRADQVVIFPGVLKHWVPKVTRERITAAANFLGLLPRSS